ncbi:hypothetical protein YC2023_053790 [Brassica napus]
MGTETDGSNLFSVTSSPLEMSEQSEQNEKANVEPSKVLKHTLKADQTRPSRLSISTSSSMALTGNLTIDSYYQNITPYVVSCNHSDP